MLKTLYLMKNKFKFFSNRIFKFIYDLCYDNIVKPYKVKQEILREKRAIEELKKDFEKRFNTKVSHVKKLIDFKTPWNAPLVPTSENYLKDKLIEGKLHTNKVINDKMKYGVKTPYFYEPDICDIHNENPDRSNYQALNTMIKKDSDLTTNILRDNMHLLKKMKQRAKLIWKTRL